MSNVIKIPVSKPITTKIIKTVFPRTMVRGLVTFLMGLYSGVYLAQNYDVPKVDEPQEIYKKLKDFADKHRKGD